MTNETGGIEPVFEAARFEQLPTNRLFSLTGKVAVVTGGAGGIGRWLSAGMATAGATVVVTDRDAASTEAVSSALTDAGLRSVALVVDLEDDSSASQIVDATVKRLGRLDILVNNAGINNRVPMLDVTSDVLEHIWKIDFIRCYELSQAAARVMIEQDGGAIIHISSLNSVIGLEDVSMLGP